MWGAVTEMSYGPARYGQPLTEHEIDILTAVAHGLTDNAIGKRLCISSHTVKTHLRRMSVKLGAKGRANLVARGFVHGYLRVTAESIDKANAAEAAARAGA